MKRSYRNYHAQNNRNIIYKHIKLNLDKYIIVLTIFIIGICIGVSIINNLPDSQSKSIGEYIRNSIDSLKKGNKIQSSDIFKQSITKNVVIVLIIWLLGLTVFGNLLLYVIVLVLGISFGYTISSLMLCFTFIQGVLFFVSSMLLQNIITIPAIIFLIVQGLKIHIELVKEQCNIKHLMVKYSIYSLTTLLILFIATIIETYVSTNFINLISKYL